ncbi:MAG: hypothetical protein KIS79_04045 [Burkholderiales bacterium]|nr:hypothetical protein [Burkholderiales bacterium]
MSKYTRNRAPFGEQSRRRRNREYIGVKNRIRHTAPILGGRFTTHDYLHGENGWMDAPFLTIDAINIFITRFLRTEAGFRDPTPRSYRHEQIPFWGMEMSTLIDYTDSQPISEVDDQAS